MNLKKQVRKLDNRREYVGTNTSAQEDHSIDHINNAYDTFGIGRDSWIIEEVSDNNVTVEGYDADDTTKDNIPIGMGVSDVDLPDKNTILVVSNEATIVGESSNTIFYEKQIEEILFLVHKTEDGQKYIEAYRFIIPLTVKEDIQSMNTRQPTEKELLTCDIVHLTSDLTWNPESVKQQEITHDEYNDLVSQSEYRKVHSMNLKKLIHRMRCL